ncbi:MAG: PTS system mannose/fructose/sorbose family transporter subunit IID [Erysipelotrichaceae bacterium]|nr:PTS system mannose/fructose/sorbose family transporter subunit IID [Erysipelotrichaceae bacterium]MDY5252554.1 PTS system mannose/fructose/sorbose family transporter subunit IID [Erysipelotrichaceae bacterium]
MKLTKKTLNEIKMRHIYGIQQTWSYDIMMGSGYLWSLLPAINELYRDNPEKQKEIMTRNMQFFNTSAIFSPLIQGIHVAMMESDQNEIGENIKAAMMGPMAGVGDTLAGVIVNPITTLIGCQFALMGNWFIALLIILGVRVGWIFTQWKLFDLGYNKGVEAIESTKSNALLTKGVELVTMFGALVLGGFIPSMLSSIEIGLEYSSTLSMEGETMDSVVKVQDFFNNICPYLVPILLVLFYVYLLKKHKFTSTRLLILTFILAIIAYFTNLFVII